MPDRRKNAAKARQELAETRAEADELPDPDDDEGHSAGDRDGPTDHGLDPISDQQRHEVNDLFNTIVDAGYMPAGSYSLNIDGERAAITMSVILPSSPGTPENPPFDEQAGDAGSDPSGGR